MKSNTLEKKSGLVKSANRTLDILELIVGYPNGISLTQMGKLTGIPLSSLHELIGTLMHRNCLVRDQDSFLYRPGPALARIASTYRDQVDIISVVDPFMTELTRKTGETTSLSVLQGDMVLFVHKKVGTGVIQVVNPVGTRLPIHATGSGKVMLAYLSESEVSEIYPQENLPKLTPNTIDRRTQLLEILREVRDRGFAVDNQESTTGVWAVAGCIRDREGCPIGALSVVGPVIRLQEKDTSDWPLLVKTAAMDISYYMGFSRVDR